MFNHIRITGSERRRATGVMFFASSSAPKSSRAITARYGPFKTLFSFALSDDRAVDALGKSSDILSQFISRGSQCV